MQDARFTFLVLCETAEGEFELFTERVTRNLSQQFNRLSEKRHFKLISAKFATGYSCFR